MLHRLNGPLGLALVLLVTFAAYVPSLGNGYAMDDRLVAMGMNAGRKNAMIHELRSVAEYFRSHYWKGSVEEDRLYRPVTVWSYALVHRLARPSEPDPADTEQKQTAFPQHLLNVLLHLGALLVVYALLLRLGLPTFAGLIGALVFGLHAVHSEVVATVVGRAELFAFVFGGGAVLLLFSVTGRGVWWQVLAGLGATVLFFLAFASKENALAWIGFLPVFWLTLGWRRGEGMPKDPVQLAVMLVAAVLPLVLFLLLRSAAVGEFPDESAAFVVNPLAHQSWGPRILSAVFVWAWKGIGLTLFPFDLACTYGAMVLPIIRSPLDPRFLLAAIVLLGMLAGGILGARRHPLLFLAMAVFLGFSFLISNVPLAIGTVFGERLYYIPSLGFAILVGWALERAAESPRYRGVLGAAICVWLGASTLVILERNPVWENDETLFLHEVENQPRSIRMHLCAATIHTDRKEPAAAERHLREALRIDPEYALAWNNLGADHLEAGRLAAAEACIRAGLGAAHVVESEDLFKLHANLGIILKGLGRGEDAFVHLLLALRKRPTFERSYSELTQLCSTPEAAERLLEELEALEIEQATEARWPYYRGRTLLALNRPGEAEAAFRAALGRDPSLAKARVELLALLLPERPGRDVSEMSDVIAAGDEHAPDRPEWPYYRGRLLVQAGRKEEALAAFLEALGRDGEFAAAWQEFSGLLEDPGALRHGVLLLRTAESKRPHYPYWSYFLGTLLERQEKAGEALWAYGRALAARPRFVPAWHALRGLADRTGDYQTMLDVVERAADTHGGDLPEFDYFRGVALRSFGAALGAVNAFNRALASKPDFLDARLELLALVHESFAPDDVRAIVRGGVAHDPENPHWPLYRGLVLHRENEYAQAVSALQCALAGMPGHVEARLALADSLASLGRKDEARAVYQGLADDPSLAPEVRQHAAERAGRL